MKKRMLAGILGLLMVLALMPASVSAVTSTPSTAPTISGPTEMTLTVGYSAPADAPVSTAAYTVYGDPAPTVTQNATYDDKIVWNDVTKKLDIAAGLEVGSYPVVLTAANSVSNASLTFTLTVSASGSLTTLFASNNTFSGNMFDMEVTGTYPLRIDSFDVNIEDIYQHSCTMSVYYREGGYSGYESTASAWTLIGTQSGVLSAGGNQPTALAVGGIVLEPGTRYGFYVTVSDYAESDVSMLYTNMPVGTEYSDGSLKLISGIGRGKPDFDGQIYNDRAWNGTVYYTPVIEDASLSGPTEMTLSEGYAATATAAFTVGGVPSPTVTQDTTYNDKIVWNNTTKKLDIAAGLAAGSYPVTLTALNGTAAELTFTLKVHAAATVNSNLLAITPLKTITGLANGTSRTIDALGLPSAVTILTDNGSEFASVIWDMTSCTYIPSITTPQTFTVNGVVTLPLNVSNPNRIATTVTISVTVDAAPVISSLVASSAASSAVSDITVSNPASQPVDSGASVPAMGNQDGNAAPYLVGFFILTAAVAFIAVMLRKLRSRA